MRFLRFILFCVFFAIGAGSIALSIVAEEIYSLYSSRRLVVRFTDDNRKITSLSKQYDSQMRLIRSEPNSLNRLKGIMLGKKSEPDEDVAIPQVSEQELINASNALLNEMETTAQKSPAVAEWLKRCNRPGSRTTLFFAGAALVLTSFVFFSSPVGLKRRPAETDSD